LRNADVNGRTPNYDGNSANMLYGFEAAEMKLLRPLAGYTLYDHKTNDYIRRELRIAGILDKVDK